MMHYKRHDKPPYSYLGMIIVAIQYSPDQALSLSEVVKALPHMFPFFSGTYTGWKDSIRHNLSGNKCFEKVPSKVPSVSAKARCVNRWRIDWSRVPHDVFQLQRGRPGCSDPKWKPTLQQYLGLPDVFLPKQPKATQVKATANQMPAHLFIRQAKKKSRLDSVSPAQYLAAYSRILARLIEIGHLSGQGIIDYLAYTAKVSEMATRYTW
nr:hypothetical protein BaRGS_032058 [Batillaria attramentaria]